MNAQLNTQNVSNRLPLVNYLAVQLQEIICMGPGHTMMWADNHAHHALQSFARPENLHDWLQVSVQGGAECHLMVQFPLPEAVGEAAKRQMDHLFAQYGWTHEQADGRECLVYYVAQSSDPRHLLDEAETAAQQCAQVMERLWSAHDVNDIALLAARGPKLAQSRALANPANQPMTQILSRAA